MVFVAQAPITHPVPTATPTVGKTLDDDAFFRTLLVLVMINIEHEILIKFLKSKSYYFQVQRVRILMSSFWIIIRAYIS